MYVLRKVVVPLEVVYRFFIYVPVDGRTTLDDAQFPWDDKKRRLRYDGNICASKISGLTSIRLLLRGTNTQSCPWHMAAPKAI